MIKTVKVGEDKIKLQIWVLNFVHQPLITFSDRLGYRRPGALSLDHSKVRFLRYIPFSIALCVFSYYRSAHAIVLVYDVACQPSFDCLPEWLSEIEQYANRKVLKILVGSFPFCFEFFVYRLLVGNKVDKEDEREVPERIGKSFADANGFDYFLETSALDATNVDTLFQQVATRLTNEMKTSDDR